MNIYGKYHIQWLSPRKDCVSFICWKESWKKHWNSCYIVIARKFIMYFYQNQRLYSLLMLSYNAICQTYACIGNNATNSYFLIKLVHFCHSLSYFNISFGHQITLGWAHDFVIVLMNFVLIGRLCCTALITNLFIKKFSLRKNGSI